MESKPIRDRDFLLRSSTEPTLGCGSGPLLSANTEEEQKLIDEIVEMTSDMYDLDYAK